MTCWWAAARRSGPRRNIRDDAGTIQGVRYDELAPMLLNEVQTSYSVVQRAPKRWLRNTAERVEAIATSTVSNTLTDLNRSLNCATAFRAHPSSLTISEMISPPPRAVQPDPCVLASAALDGGFGEAISMEVAACRSRIPTWPHVPRRFTRQSHLRIGATREPMFLRL